MPHDPIHWLLLGYGAVIIAGVIAGGRGSVVVFADLGDLVTTFSIMAVTVFAGYLILASGSLDPAARSPLLAGCVALALAAIGWRSWRDNRSVPAALLATLTKLPFSAAVPLLALQAVAPSGGTAAQRASRRAVALLLLTVLAPLIFLLVRNKDGLRRYLGVT